MTAFIRQFALAIALGVAVFVVANYSMSFPQSSQGISSIWLTNGLPVAALLRSPRRDWPWLIAAAMLGNAAALAYRLDIAPPIILYRITSNALQYCLCAYLLRRQLGENIDIAEPSHLLGIVTAGALTTCLKLGYLIAGYSVLQPETIFRAEDIFAWMFNNSLGLFVLLFPILAITSKPEFETRPFDFVGGVFLLILAGSLYLVFGPLSFPGVYIIIPPLMLLAWRHGLRGAGVGALFTIAAAAALSQLGGGGIAGKLIAAGYSPIMRGAYLELFFSVAILTSLPLAVAHGRQQRMGNALADALAASEKRAKLLAKSEAAATQAKDRMRAIIETSTDIICTLDGEGRFVDISENCEALWGWRRELLIGRLCTDFMHPDDRATTAEDYLRRIQGLPRKTPRNSYVRPDGTLVPMLWSATWAEKEQLCHCVGRDMTEHDALEAQAQQAQRMESIGQLTGGVAHDFNNLLTIIIGSSETLAAQLDQPPQRKLAELILRASERGGQLTRQLLAFARRQPLEPRSFNVEAVVEAAEPLIRRGIGGAIRLVIERPSNAACAYADPVQTEAAILNLCINARDAMPDGGKITVAIENIRFAEEFVAGRTEVEPGDYVAIRISDTGTGIAPEVVDRIFEPFFTTKEMGRGTGLGLSMVYGFVKQSQGYLDLDTELGRGTTFSLYLPASASDIVSVGDERAVDDEIEGGSENVLVVEDDDMVRVHVRAQLENLGYRVIEAPDGPSAMAILEGRDDIDLLFTDIIMPGGMNGRELGERAAARWRHLRILYTSGYTSDALTENGRLLEGVTLLSKPYSKRQLSEKVRKVLDEV
ncbi:ATP-binding protein [Rhizorhabdus argentea]|uniref:ATP-binding protein n=1 Tax=Rhizorhabdus argentea TaxID=1387174 RepID=UPI0030EC6A8F